MLLFDILQDMAAELVKIFEILKVFIDFCRVNFQIFMNEKISQIRHWSNFLSKIIRYDTLTSHGQYCLSVVIGPRQVVAGNNIMADIKEALNG